MSGSFPGVPPFRVRESPLRLPAPRGRAGRPALRSAVVPADLLQRVRALDFHCDFEVRRINDGHALGGRAPGRDHRTWEVRIWPRARGESAAVTAAGPEIDAALRAAVESAELQGWAEEDFDASRAPQFQGNPEPAPRTLRPWLIRAVGATFGICSLCGSAGASQLDALVGAAVGVSEMLVLGLVLYLTGAPLVVWIAVALAILLLRAALILILRQPRRPDLADI